MSDMDNQPVSSNDWSYCEGCGRLTRRVNLRPRVMRNPMQKVGTMNIWLGRACADRWDAARAAAPAEAREEGPVATALALIPDDGLPDRVGEHFRVVTVCGHCGEIWSEVAAIHQQDTDRAGGRG